MILEVDITFHHSIHEASHNAILMMASLTPSLMQIQVPMTTQKPACSKASPLHRATSDQGPRCRPREDAARRLAQMPYDDLAQRIVQPEIMDGAAGSRGW